MLRSRASYMAGTVLSTLNALFSLFSQSSYDRDTVIFIKNIRKMRFRELKKCPGGHKVSV